jgi:2-oxoglutarate ferredoxin oxidoreductase subunit alpha
VGNLQHQVRITASTHDQRGDLQHTSKEALDNTRRLQRKMEANLKDYTYYHLDEQDCDAIVVSYDLTAAAASEAVERLRAKGRKVSLLVCKTLFPVPPEYLKILSRYRKVVVAEENLSGQYREILFGRAGREGVSGVNAIGRMISPQEIMEGVER